VALVSAIAGASLSSGPLAGRPPVTGFDRAFLALSLLAAVSAVATTWLLPAGRPPATDLPVVAH